MCLSFNYLNIEASLPLERHGGIKMKLGVKYQSFCVIGVCGSWVIQKIFLL
ncbi:hypothetical protein Hanom_Chr06g00546631 [Helianthus anomalus]